PLGASRLPTFARVSLNTCHPEDRCFVGLVQTRVTLGGVKPSTTWPESPAPTSVTDELARPFIAESVTLAPCELNQSVCFSDADTVGEFQSGVVLAETWVRWGAPGRRIRDSGRGGRIRQQYPLLSEPQTPRFSGDEARNFPEEG